MAGHGRGRSPTLLVLWETSPTSLSASSTANPQTHGLKGPIVPVSGGFGAGVSIAALGSVPRRRGQLCSHLGPRPCPEERVLLLGLTHSRLHGHTGPGLRRGRGLAGLAGAPQPRLRSHPIAAPHSSREARGARQAWGSATWRQWAQSGAGRRTPGQMDRQTDGRTDTRESQPASHKRPTTTTKEQPGVRRGKVRLRGPDANYSSPEPLYHEDSVLHFPEGLGAPV